MITFNQFTFTYPEADQSVLHQLDLFLPEGELTLLVGPSGVGKSTLLRCLNGLVPHFSGGRITGHLTVNGLDPVLASPQVMSQHVGFVFQEPESQFVVDRVEDEIAFALENAALPPTEMRLRVEEVLDLLDLAPLRARRLETLSGGEQQRVAIAAALALRPRILVLDEPTSQLDPKSAEDVLQALVRLNNDLGLTIILSEHRMERVLPYVDQLLYLDGQTIHQGHPADILPDMPLQPPLVQVATRLGWEPLPLTIKAGRRFSRRLTLTPPANSPALAVDPNPAGPPRIITQGVKLSYDQQPVLNGVDLTLYPGQVVALMGRNGSGKTSLLKCLVGLQRPDAGQIQVGELDATQADVQKICQQVGYLPQDPNALLFAETVEEELLITLKNHGLPPTGLPGGPSPASLLATLGLSHLATAYPRDLSAGERQRVALGAVMITRPQVLLLDEPTRGLDYVAKAHLIDLLRRWQAEGLALLLVTHDVELAAALADRVVLLSQGEVIAAGTPAAVMGNSPLFAPQIARLFPDTGWLTAADALNGLGNL